MRRRSPAQSGDRVSILLMHAWGMGGTIRSCMQVAGYLADHNDVELLSVVRRRDDPHFAFPAGVSVHGIDDQRPDAPAPRGLGLVRRIARKLPSVLVHSSDHASSACTLWTDLCMAHTLRSRREGVLIGTRPGLNMIVAEVAPTTLVAIGQEHMHLAAHPRRLRDEIAHRYPSLDAVVTLTEEDREAYEAIMPNGMAVVQVPNAVTPPGGEPAELTAPRIMAAGRLTPQKGFDMLIPAFAQVVAEHPEWTLQICGSGGRKRALERRIAKLGLEESVELVGPMETLRPAMESASMYVLSSRFEGLPLVLLEAMSKGLPVVSFDCPTGPRDIVDDHRNGILVPAGDVDGLARAMLELVEDPELRRRFGDGAIETAQRYAMAEIGPRWDALLAQLRDHNRSQRLNVLLDGDSYGATARIDPPKEDLVHSKKIIAAGATVAGMALATGVAFGAGGQPSGTAASGAAASAPASRLDDGKDLLGQAKISEQDAIAAAQKAASGKLNEVDLEHVGGKLVFNVDVGNHDVKVDAATGDVVRSDQDD